MMSSTNRDTVEGDFMTTSAKMWKDIVFTGGEFKDNAVQQDVEINLIDQNTNSLQQLNSYFEKLSAGRKKPL
jgi:hypothetical protein